MKTHRPIPDKAQKVKPRDLRVSLHMVFIINGAEGQDCPSSQGGWAAGTFAPSNPQGGGGFQATPSWGTNKQHLSSPTQGLSQTHTAGQVATSLAMVWAFLSLEVHRCP